MARPLIPDRLWSILEPLLPPPKPAGNNGRPRVGHRQALTGILFVLKTGIPWEYLPAEMGCGSGMTCWRRLRDWQTAGIWERLLHAVLQELTWSKQIDWSRASLDSASIPAKRGARRPGQTRRIVVRPGTKRHVITDRNGTPLAIRLTGANRNDSMMVESMLDAVPSLKGPRGRPRRRPGKLHADKAYDHRRCRRECRERSVIPRIARRGVEDSKRLGRYHWVVERTLAWISRFRRLTVRYERRADIH